MKTYLQNPRIRYTLIGLSGIVVAAIIALSCIFCTTFNNTDGEAYIYIKEGDSTTTTLNQLEEHTSGVKMWAVRSLCSHFRPGKYQIGDGNSTLQVIRNLRNGHQEPVRLTIPIVRTKADLARHLATLLCADAEDFETLLNDTALCSRYGLDTCTILTLFVPNTYEVYWNTTPVALIERMDKESKAFWTPQRKAKADAAGLSCTEVITLASIVEQETAYNPEKPAVAGMYLNRLHRGMKLQADPTVKYAVGDFGIRRVLNTHLRSTSPYNTYRYEGLPPGPICIPSVASIEAVLDYQHHDYIFMCAKEDFSGRHNFATTDVEHMANARRYAEALDKRGIK